MKKMLALMLSLSLIMALIPFGASATDIEQQGYNTLVNKAVAAFPEYAEKLLNPSYSPTESSRTAAPRVLVVKETRSISDSELITYTEYSDGLILLSGYEFTCNSTSVGSSSGSGYRSYTINITAACVATGYNGYFYLDGVSYTLRTGYNVYDSITNPGTARKGNFCAHSSRDDYTSDESAYGYARIAYTLGFRIGNEPSQVVTSKLTVHVGEDTAIVDHIDWN